jgi:hypothetical protein
MAEALMPSGDSGNHGCRALLLVERHQQCAPGILLLAQHTPALLGTIAHFGRIGAGKGGARDRLAIEHREVRRDVMSLEAPAPCALARLDGVQDDRGTAARHHAFFNGDANCVQRVFDAGLLFLHLDFGRGTDLDHGHATGEPGNALLQLFLAAIAGGFLDLPADRLD